MFLLYLIVQLNKNYMSHNRIINKQERMRKKAVMVH